MPSAEQEAANRLQSSIVEAHVDALRHPDPRGVGIMELLQAVQRHVREEASTVDTYARLGRETSDPVVAVIMQLLVEDEQRHHALFERIAESLRDRFNWAAESTTLPLASAPMARADSETARLVVALADDERRGAQALRDLAQRQHPVDAGLIRLLLEAMAIDSDKHARLLAFVADRLA